MSRKEFGLTRQGPADPFALLRQLTSDFDRMFDYPGWRSFGWPRVQAFPAGTTATWFPETDVFVKDNRLVTKIDLPGLKKEEVKVEVTDGQLAISGERRSEAEDRKENFYRCEREHGFFFRTVPLPEGVKFEDVQATFVDGVLEVSVPLPAPVETKPRKVEVKEPPKAVKAA